MKQISLPKKFEIKCSSYPFVYNENWISNGHFAVKKELVKDYLKYCINDEKAEVDIERIIPMKQPFSEWNITNKLYESKSMGYLRVFQSKYSNKEILFREDYIKHFKIEKLYGEDFYSPFINENETLVLMAARI